MYIGASLESEMWARKIQNKCWIWNYSPIRPCVDGNSIDNIIVRLVDCFFRFQTWEAGAAAGCFLSDDTNYYDTFILRSRSDSCSDGLMRDFDGREAWKER
jgi:hypothetical protein